jgi:hypothetical protein
MTLDHSLRGSMREHLPGTHARLARFLARGIA